MSVRIFAVAAAAVVLSSSFVSADAARSAAQQCIAQTHAPGNYNISNDPGVPHVIPAAGGTPAGAANVNDCLADAYGVQYGAKRAAPVAVDGTLSASEEALYECKRLRRQRVGNSVAAAVGFTLGVGDPYTAAAVGGAIGVGVTANRENRRYADCVAAAYAPPPDPNAAIFTGCSRRGGVMSQGTSLCVAQ